MLLILLSQRSRSVQHTCSRRLSHIHPGPLHLQVIVASHFGRPDPSKQSREQMAAKYSLRPVAQVGYPVRSATMHACKKGRPNPLIPNPTPSLSPGLCVITSQVLSDRLAPGSFTGLAPDCVGLAAQAAVEALQPGQVGCSTEDHLMKPAHWARVQRPTCHKKAYSGPACWVRQPPA